ncbi:hypothetical protein BV20DRAFT_960910 [Pilatotrama ljubarskyi]|nr:hypothetical protein BV20DRAFT_960910 [Pilatotrama ljubarskyi]
MGECRGVGVCTGLRRLIRICPRRSVPGARVCPICHCLCLRHRSVRVHSRPPTASTHFLIPSVPLIPHARPVPPSLFRPYHPARLLARPLSPAARATPGPPTMLLALDLESEAGAIEDAVSSCLSLVVHFQHGCATDILRVLSVPTGGQQPPPTKSADTTPLATISTLHNVIPTSASSTSPSQGPPTPPLSSSETPPANTPGPSWNPSSTAPAPSPTSSLGSPSGQDQPSSHRHGGGTSDADTSSNPTSPLATPTASVSVSPTETYESTTITTVTPTPSPTGSPSPASTTAPGNSFVQSPNPDPTSSAHSSAHSLSSAAAAASDPPKSHTGAIVGGVLGGLALLLLAACAVVLVRRLMRARRTAPSAEFMNLARGNTGTPTAFGATPTPGLGSGDRLIPLARQTSVEDHLGMGVDVEGQGGGAQGQGAPPPPFTPGDWTDPVYEKVQAAAAALEHWQRRESSDFGHGHSHGYGADGVEKDGDVYEDALDGSTEAGDHRDPYGGPGGAGDEEKGGYAWAM